MPQAPHPEPDPTEAAPGDGAWTCARVAAWLETAFRVLAVIQDAEDPTPAPGHRRLANSWDGIRHAHLPESGRARPRIVLSDAQRAIHKRVLEDEGWPFWIADDDQFQAVVHQACGVGPARLAKRLGVDRATIWRRRQAGLRRIRDRLNAAEAVGSPAA